MSLPESLVFCLTLIISGKVYFSFGQLRKACLAILLLRLNCYYTHVISPISPVDSYRPIRTGRVKVSLYAINLYQIINIDYLSTFDLDDCSSSIINNICNFHADTDLLSVTVLVTISPYR